MASYILIVEDDPGTADLLHQLLTEEGYRVAEVATNKAAYESVRAQIPDMILLDFMLPDGPSDQVVRKLRAWLHEEMPPVVLMTAHDPDRNAALMDAAGVIPKREFDHAAGEAEATLRKPFTPNIDIVLETARRVLARAALRKVAH